MSGRELTQEEKDAGALVAAALGGRLIERDGKDGSHDFDIEVEGRTIALEVTAAADEAIEALYDAAFKPEHQAPGLAHSWWIGIDNDGRVRVRALMAKLPPHLAVLERHGIEHVGGGLQPQRRVPDNPGELQDATRALFAAGVRFARRLKPPLPSEAAELLISLTGGASSNFDQLNALVTECAERKAPQLIAAGGDERHLFVRLRASVSDAELALATLPPPEQAPTVPTGVDVVWVATHDRLWRVRPPGGWEVIESPSHSGGRAVARKGGTPTESYSHGR